MTGKTLNTDTAVAADAERATDMTEPKITREEIEAWLESLKEYPCGRFVKPDKLLSLLTLALQAEALEQQLSTAREALEPFAKEAFRYEPPEGDDDMNAWDSRFTIGQLRRAAAAIRSLGEPGANSPGE